jgi:hypothetical protein
MKFKISEAHRAELERAVENLQASMSDGAIQSEVCYNIALLMINMSLRAVETDEATRANLQECAQTLHYTMMPHSANLNGHLN